MAFSSAVTKVIVVGNRRMAIGTYTNTSGSTGGAMGTGLKFVNVFIPGNSDAQAANTARVQINVASAGQVTLTTDGNADGEWVAWGI